MEIYAMHYNALNTGKRIQKLRKDKGLTQEQLAERLNLSTVHMAKIETGQRSCSLDVSRKKNCGESLKLLSTLWRAYGIVFN